MISRKTIVGMFALLTDDPGVTADVREAVIRALEQGQAAGGTANVRVVKFAETADRLGVSVQTVRNMVRSGRLKAAFGSSSSRAIGVKYESLVQL